MVHAFIHVISEKDPHFHGVYVLVVEADGLYILEFQMLVSALKKIKARGMQESVWARVMEILLHGVFGEVSLFRKTWASEALRKEQVAGL